MTITTDATTLEKDKTAKDEAAVPPGRHKLYLATWRWHFYAGIFVIPFMIMLPFTGLIMLYHDTIESIQYRDMLFTEPANQAISAEAQAQAVRDHFPESVVSQYIPPAAEDRTSQITIITPDEQNLTVFVDPYSGDIMGTLDQSTTLYSWANNVHGSFFMGDTGDMLIEIAAGFGVLLIISGLYLWWPRDSIRGAFLPRLRASKRVLWRNLHSSVGFYISVVLLFFLISGLSWTNVWGDKFVQAWNSFPAEKWGCYSSDGNGQGLQTERE